MNVIRVSTAFSDAPGGRYAHEGMFSGEEFRVSLLKPAFEKAIQDNEVLTIDLDGGYGYLPSFLEEAFGGLAREFPEKTVLDHIRIISNDEPGLITTIKEYIGSARK